jgi:hypothetical protein
MIKLYKRNPDGTQAYHEAWVTEQGVLEHWGVIGEVGEHQQHSFATGLDEAGNLASVLRKARENGFEELPDSALQTLVIEYEEALDDPQQAERRQALAGDLDEFLGWTGLGCCEGSDDGAGTLEVFCRVVDFDIASAAIAAEVENTDCGDFRRIYQLAGVD